MNANNKSPATSATKSALLVETTTGTRSTNDKLDQKVGSFSNQNNGESSEGASAKKEALAKQYVASQATLTMSMPAIFRH
ncbi:hypothetical protein P3T76_004096 [Phytophthora citrophthora]|uniref:Uncharacterized protein n=1 Tax=Phytophthora citrophthora TaxID=4793 RepID=A0AAD9LRJ3_9STRA|nr:hypothetical protein P3T76_004096 [Phytophthora citrophthora]